MCIKLFIFVHYQDVKLHSNSNTHINAPHLQERNRRRNKFRISDRLFYGVNNLPDVDPHDSNQFLSRLLISDPPDLFVGRGSCERKSSE